MKQKVRSIVRNYSKNLIIGLGALLLALGLLGYGIWRDRAELLSPSSFAALARLSPPSYGYIQGEYLYAKINHQNYKVIKEGIDLKEVMSQTPIEVKGGSMGVASEALDMLLLLFLLLALWGLFRFFRNLNGSDLFAKNIKNPPSKNSSAPMGAPRLLEESVGGVDELGGKISPTLSKVTFEDVAGIKEVKEELEEIIDFLKNPAKYQKFGTKLPKGVLLMGPPGVGKTLIAKAVAGEAGVPFFYQSGSSFAQIYVGMGAKRVRDLFMRAKLSAPSIIFIDEIDAVGKARGGLRNDERETTLNQLLTEMDGFEDSSGVIVIGATNKIDVLDEALLRSGRFDRRIYVELPDFLERVKILEVHLRGKQHELNLEEVSRLTVGFSGASLASLVNEAALRAIRRRSNVIVHEDILATKDKVILGKRKRLSFSDEEKKILATYQSAKALSAYWMEIEFDKVSLVNEGIKEIEKELVGKSEMQNKIKVLLSGLVALEMIYGESYSNCEEDLSKAKGLAIEMAERYGMGQRLMGDLSDAQEILAQAKSEMRDFLENSKNALKILEEKLLERERLSREELKEILHELF